LAVAGLVACGSSTQLSAAASNDPRPLEVRASNPREGDPTAAAPAPAGPATAGTSVALGKDPPAPSSTSAAPEGKAPAKVAGADPADLPKKIGARHVLVQYMGSERAAPSVVRTKDQALVVAKEVLRRAKAGEDLARLAVEFSDEPGAANRGGSLGRFGRGQMVPAFEEAAFRLKVGEVSEIVETTFGYHIIQRTE
jgi:hypothetical protein